MSEITVKAANDGNHVPMWDGLQLHSMYQPEKEGQDLANKFMQENQDTTKPLLVCGLGFGYHILPLLGKYNQIYIAEENADLISTAKSLPHTKPIFQRCTIITSTTETPYLPDVLVFTLRSENRFAEKFFANVQAALKIPKNNPAPQKNQIRVLINSPIYGGSYTTARYIETALQQIGVATHFTDNSPAYALLKKYLENPTKNSRFINSLTDLLSETLWQDVQTYQPHIVFFVAQSPFTQMLAKELAQAGIVSIYWFVEDFRRMQYWKEVCNTFDYFFMIQRGEFEKLLETTCRKTWGWFPVAAEPSVHKPITLSSDDKALFASDISFMGAAYPNRVNFFKQFKKANLKLWGTGWSESEISHYNIPLGDQRITPEQSNIIYQATKININLHSANYGYMEDTIFDTIGDFVNPRTFEIAACGGFQLVDDRIAIKELFETDKEIVCFSSVEEAKDKANFYLKNDSLRQEIALAAQKKVLQFHTYQHRVEKMIEVAIANSPTITARIAEERNKVSTALNTVNSSELNTFINQIPPSQQNQFSTVIQTAGKAHGPLKTHEAMLMLLDTFYTGE